MMMSSPVFHECWVWASMLLFSQIEVPVCQRRIECKQHQTRLAKQINDYIPAESTKYFKQINFHKKYLSSLTTVLKTTAYLCFD